MKYIVLFVMLFGSVLFAKDEFPVMLQILSKEKIPQDFRDGFEQGLTESGYSLVDENVQNETMVEQTDKIDGCIDDSCLVNVGKMLAARGVVVVEVEKKEKNVYSFKAKYLDFETGTTQKKHVALFKYSLSNYEQLIEFGKEIVYKMLDKVNELKNQEFYKLVIISDLKETFVVLNGKNLGKANMKLDLPKGKYIVKLFKDGFEDFTQEVFLDKDVIVKGVMTEKLYKLEITSNVTSKVYINGEEKGVTPLITKLKSSEYKIKLEIDGYEPSERTVSLVDRDESINIDLKAITCDITINSNNKNTSIFVDDEYKGIAPITLTLNKSKYMIEAEADEVKQSKQAEVCKDKKIKFEFKKKEEHKKEEVKEEIKEEVKEEAIDLDKEDKDDNDGNVTESSNSGGLKYFNIEVDLSYKHLPFDNISTGNLFIAKGYLTLLLYKLNKFTFNLGGIGYGFGNNEYKEISFHLFGVKYTTANIELSGNISFLLGKYFAIGNGENTIMNLGGFKLAYIKNINKINLKPYVSLNYGISANKYETESDDEKGFIFGLGFAIDFGI